MEVNESTKQGVVAFTAKDIYAVIAVAMTLWFGSTYIQGVVTPVEKEAREAHEHSKRVEARFDTFLAQDAEHEKACAEDKGRMKHDIEELQQLFKEYIDRKYRKSASAKFSKINGLYIFGGFSQPLLPENGYYENIAGTYGLGFDYRVSDDMLLDFRLGHKSQLGEDNCAGDNKCYGDQFLDAELRKYF